MKEINIINIVKDYKSKCAIKGCQGEGDYFCLKDKDIVCLKCKQRHEDINHSVISYQEYKNQTVFLKYEMYTKPIEPKQIENYNKNMDKKNKFLLVDTAEKRIVFGQKWIENGLNEKDPFLLVSFYGNTGAGKSSTIGPLCLNGDHPIPGLSSTTNSTSSDINAFIGQTDHNELKYLILDSEGIGGTRNLATIAEEAIDWSNYEKIRSKFVKFAYPKLMYLFSDILVFTFKGDPREKTQVFENLVILSKMSSNVLNNLVRPHVIILFNNQSIDDKFDDMEYAKKEYFQNEKDKLEQLNLIFKSVSVFFLPSIDGNYEKYKTQFKKLKGLIDEKLLDSLEFKKRNGYNLEKSDNMFRISKTINFFNLDPTATPDLQQLNSTGVTRMSVLDFENKKLNKTPNGANQSPDTKSFNSKLKLFEAKCDESPKITLPPRINTSSSIKPIIPLNNNSTHCFSNEKVQDIADNLVTYFTIINNDFIEKDISRIEHFEKSLKHFKSRLPDSYSKFLKRNTGITNDKTKVCEPFSTILKVVSSEINNLKPCASKHNGYYCVNSNRTHAHHQSKQLKIEKTPAGGLFGIFKKNKQILIPEIWEGDYIDSSPSDDLDLCKVVLVPTKFEMPKLDFKNLIQVCFGCILESPLISFSCGHVSCRDCSNENKLNQCPFGCINATVDKKEIDYDPLMGARILSLDGGGIRGIVECCALEKLQNELYGIKIHDLFDLIVGTSTGGLIAISLVSSNKSPTDLLKTFEIMAKDAFKHNLFKSNPILKYLLFNVPTYKREALHNCFINEVGKKQLKETIPLTRIAVTSVTIETGCFDDCLFTNYIKKTIISQQNKFIYNSSCVDSAEATSAAPAYFSPFVFENRSFYDGGVMNNNPCKVAIKETKSLWGGNKKIDILLSLGTGEFLNKNSNSNVESGNIFTLLGNAIKLLTSVKMSWSEIHNTNTELKIGKNSFRVNANGFQKVIGLDQIDNDTIQLLKNTSKQDFLNNHSLNLSINKSISSLFYLNNLEFDSKNKLLTGSIKCRLTNIPIEIVHQLNQENKFKLSREINQVKLIIIQPYLVTSKSCLINFKINNPNDEIDIICLLMSKSQKLNETSISSCPFSLSSFLNLNYIQQK